MEMVKFARSGGEANAIAIRIARAASRKDNVAVCGYHGWHDWYLAMSINKSKDLERNLVSGIDKRGVPKSLKNSIFSFNYNDFESLKKIVKEKNIGVIKMEVKRNIEPKKNFLKKVQNLAKKENIVLIFDECSSGFRETFGGIYKKYNLNPDMIVFGKALGNGYAITSVLGKRNIMEHAEKTFISSTFWTERIGPTAALKTLELMEKNKSWIQITNLGKKIKKKWLKVASNHKVKIKTWGIDAMPGFNFESKNNNIYKTFITQEMLKDKILASNNIYCSIAHNEKMFDNYFIKLNKIFEIINKFENDKLNPNSFLEGPESITGLNRLN
jgi:glutamate-1-semialdehyde 2,1-aminomutase